MADEMILSTHIFHCDANWLVPSPILISLIVDFTICKIHLALIKDAKEVLVHCAVYDIPNYSDECVIQEMMMKEYLNSLK